MFVQGGPRLHAVCVVFTRSKPKLVAAFGNYVVIHRSVHRCIRMRVGEIYIHKILYLPSHFSMALISWRNASALSSQIFHNNIKRLISISALCTRNSSATFDNYVGGLVSRLVTVINGSQWSDFHVMFDKWPLTSGYCRSLIVGRLRTVGQSR